MSAGQPVLEVKDLARSQRAHAGQISFALKPGEVMGVIGPGGSGKSGLLANLAGLVPPASGEITICGQKAGPGTARRVGYVPAAPGVYEEFTGWSYLDFFAESFEVERHYRPYLIREALRLVRLQAYADNSIGELSYGVRRSLGVARALVHDPALLVMDDCLERLDRREKKEMVEILMDVRNRGKAIVVSSPSLSELSRLCSHLCILVTDRPLACGEVRALLPQIVNLRMMHVQFLSGFGTAVRLLERHPGVFHLSVSTSTHNLVRFLFDGDDDAFRELLNRLKRQGCSVVSFAEDHSFLGKVGMP